MKKDKMGNLEAIESSEFHNVSGLLGVAGSDEIIGEIGRVKDPIRKQKIWNKLTAPPIPSRGSRAEMEKHFKELPAHIKAELLRGGLRLADALIYSIKPITAGKTIRLFESQDVRDIGLRNISNGRLPKNQALLVSSIILLAGVSTAADRESVMATKFKEISEFPQIANGEFDLKANKKVIVPETGNYVFKTANNTTIPFGYYKLSNPRLIHDDLQIEFTVNLGTVAGLDPNTQIYVGLLGTITTP